VLILVVVRTAFKEVAPVVRPVRTEVVCHGFPQIRHIQTQLFSQLPQVLVVMVEMDGEVAHSPAQMGVDQMVIIQAGEIRNALLYLTYLLNHQVAQTLMRVERLPMDRRVRVEMADREFQTHHNREEAVVEVVQVSMAAQEVLVAVTTVVAMEVVVAKVDRHTLLRPSHQRAIRQVEAPEVREA
jgi:hypothetical protein